MNNEVASLQRSTLKRRFRFCMIVSAFLFAASAGGFYFGFKQVKKPVFLIAGFAGVSEKPLYNRDITPQKLNDLINRFRMHDFRFIEPASLNELDKNQLQGRSILLTFDSISQELCDLLKKLWENHRVKSIVFLDPKNNIASDSNIIESVRELHNLSAISLGYGSLEQALNKDNEQKHLEPFFQQTPKLVKMDSEKMPEISTQMIGFYYAPEEATDTPDSKRLPRIKYVSGAAAANEVDLKNWLPPASASQGGLTITLSLMVFLIAANWAFKAREYLRQLEKLS